MTEPTIDAGLDSDGWQASMGSVSSQTRGRRVKNQAAYGPSLEQDLLMSQDSEDTDTDSEPDKPTTSPLSGIFQ